MGFFLLFVFLKKEKYNIFLEIHSSGCSVTKDRIEVKHPSNYNYFGRKDTHNPISYFCLLVGFSPCASHPQNEASFCCSLLLFY